MSLSDLTLTLVRSGAVLAVALVVVLFARKNPSLRVAAARWGLAGAALLALATPWMRVQTSPVVPVTFVPSSAFVAPSVVAPSASKAKPAPVRATVRVAEVAPSFDLAGAIPALWLGGSLLMALHLLVGVAALRRVRRRCVPVASGALTERLSRLSEEAGIPLPFFVEGEAVAGPFVAGVRRATVFLPNGWASSTDPEVVDAVLRHELAHVRNGDLRWGLFARLVRIALWPQPLVWLLKGPTAAAEEEACDRQVLAAGVPSSRYAAGLLSLREARQTSPVPALAIGAVSSRSGFGRRIEAILRFQGRGGERLSRRASFAVRGGALALAAVAAFVFAQPDGVPAQVPDPMAGWTKGPYAGRVRVIGAEGKPVEKAQAWIVVSDGKGLRRVQIPPVDGNEVVLPAGEAQEDSRGVLAVKAPGQALGFLQLWPVEKPITEIRLQKPTVLEGKLLLPDGQPAAGLTVDVTLMVNLSKGRPTFGWLQPSSMRGLAVTATTDATGAFRLEGLPPNVSVGYEVTDGRFAQLSMNDRIDLKEESVNRAKPVTLALAGRIAGRVVRDGKPVAGLMVRAQANHKRSPSDVGAYGEAITDTDGRYTLLKLAESVYNVAPDLSYGLQEEVTAVAKEGLSVHPGDLISGMDFELVPGTIIEGVVVGPDGKPLEKVWVGVYGPAHPESSAWVQTTKTDAKGRFRLRVPAGEQRVYLADGRYEDEHQVVRTEPGKVTELHFRAAVAKRGMSALAVNERLS